MPVLSGNASIRNLIDKGIVPPNCTRVTLDFVPGDVVRIYYTTLPDSKTIQDVLEVLDGTDFVRSASEMERATTLGDEFRRHI